MITIPETVKQIIKSSPFLEEGLASGIINLSSLARQIKPEIEKKLLKSVQMGAIVMALKRLERNLEQNSQVSSKMLKNLGDITVRSSLVEFTFTNSSSLLDRERELLLLIDREKSAFLTFTHGVFETTLIVSAVLEKEIENIFRYEHMRSKFTQLSAISLILPKESVEIPGLYYQILKSLAWQGINLTEVVSNYTELTVILENKEVDKAFSALKNLN